jgi:hypothetical protein
MIFNLAHVIVNSLKMQRIQPAYRINTTAVYLSYLSDGYEDLMSRLANSTQKGAQFNSIHRHLQVLLDSVRFNS